MADIIHSIYLFQSVMLDLQALIRDNMDELARSITREQGKTFADAKGDVLRGLQVIVFSTKCVCGGWRKG